MALRPEMKIPNTRDTGDSSRWNAEVAHEESIQEYMRNTELGVLTEEQMGIISLVDSCREIGIDLPATTAFFERQRRLSSGKEGIGRVQCKEIITAGAFPMSLLFQQDKPGWIEKIASFFTGKKPASETQQR